MVLIVSSIPPGKGIKLLDEFSGHNEIGCKILGAVNQFVFMGGLSWYAVMALDLHLAIRNPFRYDRV